ncbi:MAG: elongation factor Ts [Verrucomicrobiales bacterium]|nr:elongation factor Ts [Verrucomicrobiales bacterium]|tara:strand:- start:164 stop:1054 length:891 start_codon:yes stop_codon:yes gene_type:complete
MSQIKASEVKALRDKTDAPMMECKKALSEAEGDFEKAEEILRVKLGSKAGKTADRITAEGAIAIHITGTVGTIIEVNCETDFVAKNDDFLGFVRDLSKLLSSQSEVVTVDSLKELKLTSTDSVEDVRGRLIGKIGENISIRRFKNMGAEGTLHKYLHGTKIGVLLDLEGGTAEVGKDVAMHIAAMKPKALDISGIDQSLLDKEQRVAREKAIKSGKPAEIIEKMISGAVNKYVKEISLLGQVFVKAEDGKQTVAEYLKSKEATVKAFQLFVVGEGLEKKSENFAEEVAATQAASKA